MGDIQQAAVNAGNVGRGAMIGAVAGAILLPAAKVVAIAAGVTVVVGTAPLIVAGIIIGGAIGIAVAVATNDDVDADTDTD